MPHASINNVMTPTDPYLLLVESHPEHTQTSNAPRNLTVIVIDWGYIENEWISIPDTIDYLNRCISELEPYRLHPHFRGAYRELRYERLKYAGLNDEQE